MDPSYKTGEFWFSTTGAAGLLQVVNVVTHPAVQAICVISAAVVVCWYAKQRNDLKKEALP